MLTIVAALLIALSAPVAAAPSCDDGGGALDASTPPPEPIADLLAKIAAHELASDTARRGYAYTQDLTIQTLQGRTVDGELRRVTAVFPDPKGTRHEAARPAPRDALSRLTVTPRDLDDIRDLTGFFLTDDALARHAALYLGRQRLDEIDTLVFAVTPKVREPGYLSFDGRLWVDARDLVVVKTCGRSALARLRLAIVTYREQIDGAYWFPTYARAEESVAAESGSVPLRAIMKFTGYKRRSAAGPTTTPVAK